MWRSLVDFPHLAKPRPLTLPDSDTDRAIGLLAVCFAATFALGLHSDGVYHDDDLTHFLMARWTRWFPGYLLHIWGRPGFTVPTVCVAWMGSIQVGWHAARCLSAVVSAASTWVAIRVARDLGIRRLWCVVALTYLQPLNFLLAATTLTENFAALYLISAIRLLQIKRPVQASGIFSLILLTRHETAALLPLWWLALVFRQISWNKKIVSMLMSLWAVLVHQILFHLVFQEWPLKIYFEPHGSTEYLPAGWLTYVPHALFAISPFVMGLSIAGIRPVWRHGGRLIVGLAVVFFVLHVCITALGVFASGGYGRFMVTIAPLTGILAAAGLEQLIANQTGRNAWIVVSAVFAVGLLALELEMRAGRISPPVSSLLALRMAVAGLIVLTAAAGYIANSSLRLSALVALLVASGIQFLGIVHPLHLGADQFVARQTANWIRSNRPDAPLFSTDPWLSYFLGLAENPRAHKGPRLLASMPVGTIFVWDSQYSGNDFHGLRLENYLDNPAYRKIHEIDANSGTRPLRIVLLEKIRQTPFAVEPEPYPPSLLTRHAPIIGVYYVRTE